MSTPTVGVLALQGDVREHFAALAAAGARTCAVRRAEELAGVDGLVVPGGESTTISKLAVLFPEERQCAVLDVARLAAGDIAFGSNSWRGDHYEPHLRTAVNAFHIGRLIREGHL